MYTLLYEIKHLPRYNFLFARTPTVYLFLLHTVCTCAGGIWMLNRMGNNALDRHYVN